MFSEPCLSFLSFFLLPLHGLSFFDLRPLITHLLTFLAGYFLRFGYVLGEWNKMPRNIVDQFGAEHDVMSIPLEDSEIIGLFRHLEYSDVTTYLIRTWFWDSCCLLFENVELIRNVMPPEFHTVAHVK